ncbi:MAG: OmpA family protein [Flavobacteriales bacterium]|nr:OmpA family protein [Flavobacteriales bacterium]
MKKCVALLMVGSLTLGCIAQDTFTLKDTSFAVGARLVTYQILFDYNAATFRSEAYPYLDSIVQFMQQHPNLTIEVGNHRDERGSDKYSRRLTAIRSKAVVNYLVEKGIAPTRLTSRGYEESRPLVSNAKTEEEHQRNRRTELMIISIDADHKE